MRHGFSLIELLVVVAILGVLALVGVVGYLSYVEGTRDEATKANTNEIARVIRIDGLAIKENLGEASPLNQNITAKSTCGTQVKQIIKHLNQVENSGNLFNNTCYKAFNGNLALNWPNVQKSPLTGLTNGCGFAAATPTPSTTILVPRRTVMVACANSLARIGTPDYKIYTCLCVSEPACRTTDVSTRCAGNASCRRNFIANNPGKCPTPNIPQG